MPPPIVPQTVSKYDTSNFVNSKKTYEEEEIKNPLYSTSRAAGEDDDGDSKRNTAIKSETFDMTRDDLLRQMNEEDILRLE